MLGWASQVYALKWIEKILYKERNKIDMVVQILENVLHRLKNIVGSLGKTRLDIIVFGAVDIRVIEAVICTM